ncbi:MAG: hypothetical protein WEC15_04860, partial [Flavobacteriales bacterium]
SFCPNAGATRRQVIRAIMLRMGIAVVRDIALLTDPDNSKAGHKYWPVQDIIFSGSWKIPASTL